MTYDAETLRAIRAVINQSRDHEAALLQARIVFDDTPPHLRKLKAGMIRKAAELQFEHEETHTNDQ